MKLFKTITSQARILLGIRTSEDKVVDMMVQKKPVFSKARKQLPFYSLNRVTNQVIMSVGLVIYMFFDPLAGIYRASDRAKRLEKERIKFNEQLDELERLADEKVAKKRNSRQNRVKLNSC